jgi:PIN domain nuclease of toxin-antitoxin system
MKGILDTHTFIWMDSDPGKLPLVVTSFLQDANNTKLLSAASVWELVIKIQAGKLSLRAPLPQILAEQIANSLGLLPMTTGHVLEIENLPRVHKDPFDRILAAQSRIEGAWLVSGDPIFSQYPVQILW